MKKDINLIVGRFQPFTKGHLKCVEAAFEENGFPVRICMIGNTKFDNKHPFTDELIAEEMDIIKKQYSDKIEGTQIVKNGNISGIVYWLNKESYTVHSLVCGTDRAATYQKAVDLARTKPDRNPFIDDFKIIEVKRGDEDISATQVRNAIKHNDINSFEKLMPEGTSGLFDKLKTEINQIKENMNINMNTNLTDFVKHTLNEGYFINNIRNAKEKILHPFSKTQKLPYIEIDCGESISNELPQTIGNNKDFNRKRYLSDIELIVNQFVKTNKESVSYVKKYDIYKGDKFTGFIISLSKVDEIDEAAELLKEMFGYAESVFIDSGFSQYGRQEHKRNDGTYVIGHMYEINDSETNRVFYGSCSLVSHEKVSYMDVMY